MTSTSLREELDCSICLTLYTNPVMLSCGHAYCQKCIERVLDVQEESGIYTCPECRAKFEERPTLQRNQKLGNIVEYFISTNKVQEEPGICCSYCIGSCVAAVKTCLHCEAFMCMDHMKIHNKSVEHVLLEPIVSLQSRKCSIHKELLRYYCVEDHTCICVSCCLTGNHKDHKVDLLNDVCIKEKAKMRKTIEKLKSDQEETQKRVSVMQEHIRQTKRKGSWLKDRVTALFDSITEQLKVVKIQMLSEVNREEEKCSLQDSGVIWKLEKDIKKISRNLLDIEKISNMTDPINVLNEWESIRQESSQVMKVKDSKDGDLEDLTKNNATSDLDEFLFSLSLQRKLKKFTDNLPNLQKKCGFQTPEILNLLLEKNSMANLLVSDDQKTVSNDGLMYSYIFSQQEDPILSTAMFCSGQHYWEVETCNSRDWRVGVTDKSTKSNEYLCYKAQSWSLCGYFDLVCFVHDQNEKSFKQFISIKKLGIYLDQNSGQLQFYKLCDPVRLVYSCKVPTRKLLRASFYVRKGSIRILT
ncbi:tripartite motif-containing protein 6-like [Discoglossus pictus]